MKQALLLFKVALLSTLLSTFAHAAGDKEGFKLGTGFSGGTGTHTLDFDLVSPSLFSFNQGVGKGRSGIALILLGGIRWITNVPRDTGINFTTFFPTFSFGIRSTSYIPETPVVVYTILAADVSLVEKSVSSKSAKWGMRAGFGCDLMLQRNVDSLLGVSDSSFFVEGMVLTMFGQADAVPGKPDILSGFFPRVGFRSSF